MPPPDIGFGSGETFYEVLTRAVIEMTELGYDSAERVAHWVRELRAAALRSMIPEHDMQAALSATLRAVYRAKVERGGILRNHPGIHRFTVERLAPKLRAEMERRLAASVSLIRVNRVEAVEKTLRRFAGWATSVPPGGSDAVDRREVKENIGKPVAQAKFEARRVAVDQGHKFVANLSEIVAVDGGALAGTWRSNWRQKNYDYREDHRERDGQVYLIRGCWAADQGLVRVGPDGYVDQITRPGEEVFCRCQYQWIHSLRRMPDEMLTEKGRQKLAELRVAA
jgi:hypothetical protein